MDIDYEMLKGTLEATLQEIAFKTDPNDPTKNISILGRSQADLKEYLDDKTSISDDEKAKRYSDFLTNTITSVTAQAIIIAGEASLKQAQIETMKAESSQKIISMANDDKVKNNDSAVNIAKAKSEIEKIHPATVSKIESETSLNNKNIDKIAKEIEDFMPEELKYKQAQVDSMKAEIRVKERELQLKSQELLNAIDQIAIERDKLSIMVSEVKLKQIATESQISLESEQSNLAKQQANAVMEALIAQITIEDSRNEKDIRVAEIHVGAQ